jgi:nitrogen fixation NifU-like protein
MPRFSPVVVDHFTNPRNSGELHAPDVNAFVGNPVCGDQILLTARVVADKVTQIGFRAYGCSASLAVASLLTTILQNSAIEDIAQIDATRIEELAGGFAPDQRHVAALGADVARRLAHNHQTGKRDDNPITCSS